MINFLYLHRTVFGSTLAIGKQTVSGSTLAIRKQCPLTVGCKYEKLIITLDAPSNHMINFLYLHRTVSGSTLAIRKHVCNVFKLVYNIVLLDSNHVSKASSKGPTLSIRGGGINLLLKTLAPLCTTIELVYNAIILFNSCHEVIVSDPNLIYWNMTKKMKLRIQSFIHICACMKSNHMINFLYLHQTVSGSTLAIRKQLV
ncbi:hypothetical protein OSB04_006910 [Centaurea solstitialis]|uniref:Uncharacterized protein n=1 Tax=Centaurea solstitialis TaxID=347529 RepID=A0AA38TIU6_9ASTR|nr:hypothetical protein OSB04_006910 [Centaurea solstitialis]